MRGPVPPDGGRVLSPPRDSPLVPTLWDSMGMIHRVEHPSTSIRHPDGGGGSTTGGLASARRRGVRSAAERGRRHRSRGQAPADDRHAANRRARHRAAPWARPRDAGAAARRRADPPLHVPPADRRAIEPVDASTTWTASTRSERSRSRSATSRQRRPSATRARRCTSSAPTRTDRPTRSALPARAPARRPVRRVLYRARGHGDGHPSGAAGCPTAHAADPRVRGGAPLPRRTGTRPPTWPCSG